MNNINSGNTQWLTFLLAAAALHGLWLAGLLFAKNEGRQGLKLLAAAFVLVSLYLLNYLFFLTGFIRSTPHLLGVFYPLFFLIGPCFYFFVRHSLAPDFRFGWAHLWHLLLPVAAFFDTLELYALPAATKLKAIDVILSGEWKLSWLDLLLSSGFLVQLIVYVAAAWWLAWRFEHRQDGPPNQRNARWYRQFCMGFLIFLLLDLAARASLFALEIDGPVMEMVVASLLALAIQLAGYRAIGRLGDFPKILPALAGENGNGKYKTSPLTPEQMEAHQDELLSLMKREQPHLDASLKISGLAERLGIPSHHLSQVLNEGMETNFYDFVNSYRVEAAKRRLKDKNYRHYSILAIGLECGFANKTTFNRTFKKMTGLTPSEYMAEEKEAMK